MRNIFLVVPVLFFIMTSCDDGVKAVDSCGDGFVDPGEQCDGADLNGADCTTEGFYFAPGLSCRADCTFDTTGCAGRCGDGVLDDAEQCEGNNVGDATCLSRGFSGGTLACDGATCTYDTSGCSGVCGNGTIEGDEVCDDGGNEPDDGCSPGCQVELGWECNGVPSYCEPICGDGLVVGDEACDGDEVGEDTCDSLGFYTGTITCESDCSAIDTTGCVGRCGDGVADTAEGEECDGTDLADATCGSVGLAGNGIICSPGCTLDASGCTRWVDVVCGGAHTCATDSNGTVWCWGEPLPAGGTSMDPPPNDCVRVPTALTLSNTAIKVAAGYFHTCAILADHSLWCWGSNTDYQLGAGTLDAASRVPLPVVGMSSDVSDVSTGSGYTCAVKSGGVYCWGANGNGQIGDGSTTTSQTPVAIALPGGAIVQVTTGASHTCAVNAVGALFCWGASYYGQLGFENPDDQPSPTQVQSIDSLEHIFAGLTHTCGVKTNGTLWCWGANFYGQLGVGTTVDTSSPMQVTSMGSSLGAYAKPEYNFNCMAKGDLTAWCWGQNMFGQLGNGTGGGGVMNYSTTPVRVTGLNGVVALGAGENHACAVLQDGTLWCWGSNERGQLGNVSILTDTNLPVRVQAP